MARTPDDTNWPHKKWLGWFLDNHSCTELIPLGVWKAKKWIIADHGDDDEAIAAMRAAFALDGRTGAVGILGAVMVNALPEGAVIPELPEGWDQRLRYRYEEFRNPDLRNPQWGVKVRDR